MTGPAETDIHAQIDALPISPTLRILVYDTAVRLGHGDLTVGWAHPGIIPAATERLTDAHRPDIVAAARLQSLEATTPHRSSPVTLDIPPGAGQSSVQKRGVAACRAALAAARDRRPQPRPIPVPAAWALPRVYLPPPAP